MTENPQVLVKDEIKINGPKIYNGTLESYLARFTEEEIETLFRQVELLGGSEIPQEIIERRITSFCSGCDHFSVDNPCLLGLDYQFGYAKRGLCIYARVDDKHVIKIG